METKKFKTNAKCGGCVAKIKTELNKIVPENQWSIDLTSPKKTLTVTSDQPAEKIIEAVQTAGFKAEPLN